MPVQTIEPDPKPLCAEGPTTDPDTDLPSGGVLRGLGDPRALGHCTTSHEAQKARVFAQMFGSSYAAPKIGPYSIMKLLGEGGMGSVYSAYDHQLDRRVAVKRIKGGDDEATVARMRREAQALAKLSHPNVVPVYEVGTHEGRLYFSMEYVRGQTLEQWQSAEGRTWMEVLRHYLQAGRGLAAAHAIELVHRDFKPHNAVVGEDGRVRVLDFGLVTAPQQEVIERGAEDRAQPGSRSTVPHPRLTSTGAIMGTPAYMAPEQFEGGAVNHRTDQFSFCVALWEAMYGTRPFAGSDVMSIYSNAVLGMVSEPSRSDVPAGLRAVLERGLRRKAEDRWPDMEALLLELERWVPSEEDVKGRYSGVDAAITTLATLPIYWLIVCLFLRPQIFEPASALRTTIVLGATEAVILAMWTVILAHTSRARMKKHPQWGWWRTIGLSWPSMCVIGIHISRGVELATPTLQTAAIICAPLSWFFALSVLQHVLPHIRKIQLSITVAFIVSSAIINTPETLLHLVSSGKVSSGEGFFSTAAIVVSGAAVSLSRMGSRTAKSTPRIHPDKTGAFHTTRSTHATFGLPDKLAYPATLSSHESIEKAPTLGRYSILSQVSKSKGCAVYIAFDEQLERRVALKVHEDPEDPDTRERMLRGSQAMARVSSPHVAPIFEVNDSKNEAFVAMEYIEGSTLEDWCHDERKWHDIVTAYQQAARGLAAAHIQGLVIQGFNPCSALIGSDGRVRIVDYEFVSTHNNRRRDTVDRSMLPVDRVSSATSSEPYVTVSKDEYIAPEQLSGGEVDHRSDQFSFCVSLWKALYGRRPPQADRLQEIAQRQYENTDRDDVPQAIRTILERGLRLNPDDRWPDMLTLADALLNESPSPKRVQPQYRYPGRPIDPLWSSLIAAGVSSSVLVLRKLSSSPSSAIDDVILGLVSPIATFVISSTFIAFICRKQAPLDAKGRVRPWWWRALRSWSTLPMLGVLWSIFFLIDKPSSISALATTIATPLFLVSLLAMLSTLERTLDRTQPLWLLSIKTTIVGLAFFAFAEILLFMSFGEELVRRTVPFGTALIVTATALAVSFARPIEGHDFSSSGSK